MRLQTSRARCAVRGAVVIAFSLSLALALPFAGASSQPAFAGSEFKLIGGTTLSSPRTALSSSLSAYLGYSGGFGFNIHLSENVSTEIDALYVTRRYAGDYSVSTLMLPALFKLETGFLMIGIGPYAGFILGASNDTGTPATSEILALSSVDFGVVAQGGIKLPLTQTLTGVIEGRVARAFTASYDTFFWSQIQGFVGVQIKIGKKPNSGR